MFFRYLVTDPLGLILIAFVALVVMMPLIVRWFGARRGADVDRPATTRFLGTQLDFAILVAGTLLLAAAAIGLYRAFF